MKSDEIIYPYKRECKIKSVEIDRYQAIKENWQKSKESIEKIRKHLKEIKSKIPSEVITIAAAGSIGRMEAADVSDADLIIVLSDDIDLSSDLGSDKAKEIHKQVWELLTPLKLTKPKDTGVFATPTNQEELLNSIGDANEKYETYGKRLLLLLETQPVYKNEEYKQIIDTIIDRYAEKYVVQDSKKEWTLLLNDLIRYFRSLAVNYQSDFAKDTNKEKWGVRNLKLRHSRLIMYSGLLMLIGEASKERKDKVTWLKKHLGMTPLERIAWVYDQNNDYSFHRVIGHYNTFLFKLSNQSIRDGLTPLTYEDRYSNDEFSILKANSDGLIAELLRFIFERRRDWSERFFEYLIF